MSANPEIWINGELMLADEMRVSPFDLGLTVGLGVFETMVSYDGDVFMFTAHYDRMLVAAEKVGGITAPDIQILKKGVSDVLSANDLQKGRARVRVSVSAGVNPLVGGVDVGNVIITAVSLADPPQAVKSRVAKLVTSASVVDEESGLIGLKTASYAAPVIAYRNALKEGADEALLYNKKGNLAEGAMSNVFIVKAGVVYTPDLSSGCLAGVTRAVVLQLCEKMEMPTVEGVISKADVLGADEIFLTSSTREVQPAVVMGASQIERFPVTEKIASAYRQAVKLGGARSISGED